MLNLVVLIYCYLILLMITLYRAISEREKEDYDRTQSFNTGMNTLEAKQFFKSRIAIKQFVESSVMQNYDPPYIYLLIIRIDETLLRNANPTEMKLDGFDAVNINEDDLLSFNNCVTFVKQELL